MNTTEREQLLAFLKEKNTMAEGVFIDPKELIFEENVKIDPNAFSTEYSELLKYSTK